jgi:hypothetical protein
MPPAAINVEQLIVALTSKQVTDTLSKIFDDLLSTRLSKLESDIQSLTSQIHSRDERIQQLEIENSSIKLLLDEADQRLEQLEAYSRFDNVIVHGIPESYAERASNNNDNNAGTESSSDTENSILKFFNNKLNVDIKPNDISVCHRLKRINRTSTYRPVIIRFTNRKARAAVLASKKLLKTKPECKGIFINEHLTNMASKIFNKTRELCKEKKINSTWSWNGKIYIKLLDGHTISNVPSLSDLDRFK